MYGQGWCTQPDTSIHGTTFPGKRRHDFPFTSKFELFSSLRKSTIVHKEEEGKRLCEISDGMGEWNPQRKETIFFYTLLHLPGVGIFPKHMTGGGHCMLFGETCLHSRRFEPMISFF